MRKIGFHNHNEQDKEDVMSSLDFIKESKNSVVLKSIEKDIAKIILDYCDARLYPMRVGEERDKWFLEQIRKVRIRYLEEI